MYLQGVSHLLDPNLVVATASSVLLLKNNAGFETLADPSAVLIIGESKLRRSLHSHITWPS